MGMVIVLVFFLYLVFTALGLTSKAEKEIMFDQIVSDTKITQLKDKLFNTGVHTIFLSFSAPVYFLSSYLMDLYLQIFCFVLIYILLHLLFRD
jgi:uncharacterized membrane protein